MTLRAAVVVGGGFFGCAIAAHLSERGWAVTLVERELALCRRASLTNQARVHNGYHYPRSLFTAYRSRANFARFLRDYGDAIVPDVTALYAIAARRSQVSARQFERFCSIIGAPLKPAPEPLARLFDPRLVQEAYEVQEAVFDARALEAIADVRLRRGGVHVRLGVEALAIDPAGSESLVRLADNTELRAALVVNCTYAALRRIRGAAGADPAALRHEITELALIDPPAPLRALAITLMDGPFFSTMPYPPRGLHSLSHVRYTPHCAWVERADGSSPPRDPYATATAYHGDSRATQMLKDARRYVPALADARIAGSLFEVKTVLVRSDLDDGRPILFERAATPSAVYSIMGGKLDNVYDALERLDAAIAQ